MKTIVDYATLEKGYVDNEVTTRATLGAHNLLPITASTQTKNEVTYTINDNGSITTSISGTLSADTDLYILSVSDNVVINNSCILSGCPSGGTASTYYLEVVNRVNNVTQILGKDIGSGFTFNAGAYPIGVRIVLKAGQTGSLTWYPMIRLATDTNTTYTPYAMTNRELTLASLKYVDIDIKDTAITTSSNGIYYGEINPNLPSTSEIVSVEWSNDGFLGWETGIFFTCYNRRVQLQSLVSRTISSSRKIRIYYR